MELKNEGVQALTVHGQIDSANLKKNQYTMSLLNEALRAEALNRQEINNIQFQIMLVLKDMIMSYTRGESTSVTNDTAEGLLNSILYCIDAFTLSRSSPEEAIRNLLTMDLADIHKKGIELVSQWFDEAKRLYGEIRENKLDVGVDAYRLTISEGIPLFFKKYGVVFESHNTMASIDYPLIFDDMSLRGVLYMKNYLEHFKLETEFCNFFSTQEIEKLLINFGRMIRMDYRIELINIFELVFNNSVFSVLSGNTGNELLVSEYHFNFLNMKLKTLSPVRINMAIGKAIARIIGNLHIEDAKLLEYINRYKALFVRRVVNAVKNDSLESIIIIGREEKIKSSTLVFKEGERMDNESFMALIDEIMALESTADRVRLIKSSNSSLYDFVDILNSDCLFGDEFAALFGELGDMELAILARMVFYEELRSDFSGFSSIVLKKKQVETEWQASYIRFLQKQDKERMKLIENYLSEIGYEETDFR